jgi:GNAT superfamily N-acetyltransferase
MSADERSHENRLRSLCEQAARGRFPDQDWMLEIVPAPSRVVAAICAFTAHHVLAADLSEDEVTRHLDADDMAAPMNPTFLRWLGERIDAKVGHVDAVLAALGTGNGDSWLQPVADPPDNERVRRARVQRVGVRYLAPAAGGAIVTIGSGLADRCELSVEIAEQRHRGRGLGTKLLLAALDHVDDGQAVFAGVAPGNTRSLRCFLAAGFRPLGSETVLTTEQI